MLGKALTTAAAGNAGAAAGLSIEDVFSTWLYTGNGSTQTITNGIDLSGEGGLVWIKHRAQSVNNALYDTTRGVTKSLFTNTTDAEVTRSDTLTSFNSNGFTLGADAFYNYVNNAGFADNRYASWTFRKAPGFFDVVTYTGNGVAGRTVAHNLGSVPGCIIVKNTVTGGTYWCTYHRSLGATKRLYLNFNGAAATNAGDWASTQPTSTVFSVGTQAEVNTNGDTYVAYLFAHDEQIFGENEDQSVIKCGSYTGTGSSPGPRIELGWEPQFILYKAATTTGDWGIHDSARRLGVGTSSTSGSGNRLAPNTSNAETGASNFANIDATGFTITPTVSDINGSGQTYIYIAIRRGPMKTPTSGTEVFSAVAATGSTSTYRNIGFPLDMAWATWRGGSDTWRVQDRLRGLPTNVNSGNILMTTSSSAESTIQPSIYDVDNTGRYDGGSLSAASGIWHHFRRAPGFFDVVAYAGDYVDGRTINHNLGATPELMIVKGRGSNTNPGWYIYHKDVFIPGSPYDQYLTFTSDAAVTSATTLYWDQTRPTASVFTLGGGNAVNQSGYTYIAYLFATLPGISKVGSYTGTGTTLNIDCGFTSGARFVLVKRTDSTGDWYVWDTARGIVAGNDPYLLLNSNAAEVTNTDYIDPLSSGFQISSTAPAAINANGGTFVYLAIA